MIIVLSILLSPGFNLLAINNLTVSSLSILIVTVDINAWTLEIYSTHTHPNNLKMGKALVRILDDLPHPLYHQHH